MFTPLPLYKQYGLDRTTLKQRMHARGIGLGIHYQALNQFSFYRKWGIVKASSRTPSASAARP